MADARTRPYEFPPRMSETEALMWHLEKDPFLSSTFANVTVLDQPPDMADLRARMERASVLVPRLRQRVAPSIGRLTPPAWEIDPAFDIDYHVRRVALPPPGDERLLYDLTSLFATDPLDRTRPLWQFVVVEGLSGGGAALLQKMHHTLTDGEGGLRLSMQFLDTERDAEALPPLEVETPAPTGDGGLSEVVDFARALVAAPVALVQATARGAGEVLKRPAGLPVAGVEAATQTRSMLRQFAPVPPRSSLWTERSLRRRFDTVRVRFDPVHRAAKALGGTINDLFVAAATLAAAEYHRRLDSPVDALRASFALSTRTDKGVAGNSFSVARMRVPCDLDATDTFAAIHERTHALRSAGGFGATNTLAGVVNLLPTPLLVRFARSQVEGIDFATSNVRGAPFPLYLAGAKILFNYPVGPTAGTAFNVTTMSYDGWLDLGINSDAAAIAEPALLAGLIADGFDRLVMAAEST